MFVPALLTSSTDAPPAVQSVRLAAPIACTIRSWPIPPRPETSNEAVTVRVRGRRVVIRPEHGYAFVQGVRTGRDGSLVVTRRTSTDNYSIHDFIRVNGRETRVTFRGHDAFVVAYRDARNYVATFVAEEGPAQYPLSAPTTFAVRDGRATVVGPGSPLKVFGLDDMLLEIPVDAQGRPAGIEGRVSDRLSLHRRGRVFPLGGWHFALSLPDRGLALVEDAKTGTSSDVLHEWRNGRIVNSRRLPSGWSVNTHNARGDYLLRGPGPSRSNTGEDNWTMGLLRGATLTPLRFPRPKGSERLLWRDPAVLGSDRHVRFTAFYGETERGYEVELVQGT